MIAVSYHDRVNVLQEAGLQSSGPFDRAEWFTLLAETTKEKPLIALAEDGDQRVALPLRTADGRLEPFINWYSFAWRPLITPGGRAGDLIPTLARSLRAKTARITFWPVPDEDGSATLLEGAFREAGWIVMRKAHDTNHVLPFTHGSYADYLATRPGPLRTTLKRKAKKVDVMIFDTFEDDAWNIYERIYAKSWKPAEDNPAMLRRFAEAEGAAGRIRLAVAHHDGQPVAAQFWTVEGETAFIHKLTHLEEFQSLSPGTTLTAALMERVIDRDHVTLVDFGTGDDAYKRDWMDATRPRYLLDCYNPRKPASWPHLARAALRHLASRGRDG